MKTRDSYFLGWVRRQGVDPSPPALAYLKLLYHGYDVDAAKRALSKKGLSDDDLNIMLSELDQAIVRAFHVRVRVAGLLDRSERTDTSTPPNLLEPNP